MAGHILVGGVALNGAEGLPTDKDGVPHAIPDLVWMGGATGRPFQKGGSDGEVATGAPDILEGFPGPPIKYFPGPPGFPDSRSTSQNTSRTVPIALCLCRRPFDLSRPYRQGYERIDIEWNILGTLLMLVLKLSRIWPKHGPARFQHNDGSKRNHKIDI